MGRGLERKENELLLGAEPPNRVQSYNKLIIWLEKAVYVLNYVPFQMSKVILFLLMLLTTADVLGRYFLNQPILGTFEMTSLSLVLLISFSLGWTQIKKEHIMIDFLLNKFPWRLREIIKAFSSYILLGLLLLAMWMSAHNGLVVAKSNQLSSDLKLPMYMFRFMTSVGLLLFSLTIMVDVVKSLVRLVLKNES